ncbi:hypothetical protein [Pseudoduganella chitinolytica]|uniref:Amidohydrolase family protein n=1 Tax=Pseudoduganella chitinolytica TaxID=34070 RepID=A0ABY8BGA1_9BURK|nr:hypothetical protein [Pseudoduganella chitinolytica]WEF33996.1 hypothetical protein PX653_04265 [Pseudoduganella chitinolytica]
MKRPMHYAAMLAAGLAAPCALTLAPTMASAADLIITNAKIATMVKEGQFAQAVAVDGGKIVSVGSTAQILKHKTRTTRVIDGGGRTVIPGLNDSHLHIIAKACTTTPSCAGMA